MVPYSLKKKNICFSGSYTCIPSSFIMSVCPPVFSTTLNFSAKSTKVSRSMLPIWSHAPSTKKSAAASKTLTRLKVPMNDIGVIQSYCRCFKQNEIITSENNRWNQSDIKMISWNMYIYIYIYLYIYIIKKYIYKKISFFFHIFFDHSLSWPTSKLTILEVYLQLHQTIFVMIFCRQHLSAP